MLLERTQYADAQLARLAVESHHLVGMFIAPDVLFDLDVEDGVAARNLDLLVGSDACLTQHLGTVQTLGCSFAELLINHLADVAEGKLGEAPATDHLRKIRHEKVVWEFLDASDRQLCPLAT